MPALALALTLLSEGSPSPVSGTLVTVFGHDRGLEPKLSCGQVQFRSTSKRIVQATRQAWRYPISWQRTFGVQDFQCRPLYLPFFSIRIYQFIDSTGHPDRQLTAARLKQVNARLVGYPMLTHQHHGISRRLPPHKAEYRHGIGQDSHDLFLLKPPWQRWRWKTTIDWMAFIMTYV